MRTGVTKCPKHIGEVAQRGERGKPTLLYKIEYGYGQTVQVKTNNGEATLLVAVPAL